MKPAPVALRPSEGKFGQKDPARVDRWTEPDGGAIKTKVVKGACIFLNRPGFPAGAGCALHQKGVRMGRARTRSSRTCAGNSPIRRHYSNIKRPDGTSYLEITITGFDRRGWGSGGHDLDWYCSANPEAHVGREPVFRSSKAELVRAHG